MLKNSDQYQKTQLSKDLVLVLPVEQGSQMVQIELDTFDNRPL